MVGIRDLPLEVRSYILELAIHTPQGRAQSGSPASVRDKNGRRNIPTSVSGAWLGEEMSSRVWFQMEPPFNTLAALSCVSRGFYSDVKYALHHRVSSQTDYSLDIVYQKDVSLWPTWTYMPVLQRQIGTLHATIRIAQCPQELEASNQEMFRGSDGGPVAIVWLFFHLLKVFLQCGPWPLPGHIDKNSPTRISIHKLVIEFLPSELNQPVALYPSFASSDTRAAHYYSRDRGVTFFGWASTLRTSTHRTREEALLEATQMADFLTSYMRILVDISYHTFEYGRFLYESVGSIEMKLEGTTLAQMDLSQYPYRQDFGSSSPEVCSKKYAEWIVSTSQIRKKAGLPVGPLDDRFRGFLARNGFSESIINETSGQGEY